MSDELFDKSRIDTAFAALAERLEVEDADPEVMIVVGGSFMALHELRQSTLDIDVVTPLSRSDPRSGTRSRAGAGFRV